MPNLCDFDIHVKGKTKDILTFFDWMRAEYRYCEENFDEEKGCFKPLAKPECYVMEKGKRRDVAHHIGYRIFELYFDDEDLPDTDDEICLYAWGNCAWSVYTCMFEGPHTYYSDEKDYPVSLSVPITKACKELKLTVEIFSTEPGMCFAEHYVVNSEGEILKDESTQYNEIYIDDYETFDEYVRCIDETYGEEPIISRERFNEAKEEGECSICLCDWLKKYGEWPYTVV